MSQQAVTRSSVIGSFIFKNWFKIIILGVGVYILFQKDMSFTINLNSPFQKEQKLPATVAEDKEIYTADAKQLAARSSGVEKFEIPLFGSSEKRVDKLAELEKVSEEIQVAYLKRFAHVAMSEQKKYGIPASVTLASAVLHSRAGQGKLAQQENNHFDLRDPAGSPLHFDNAWSGFRAHSQYVTSGDFKSLRELSDTDYRAWANGLARLGYGADKQTAKELLILIDRFQLYELDKK